MLEPVIAFFERLISDFSLKRVMLVCGLLGAVVAALWAYENYTGALNLARIEKELGLLEQLADLRDRTESSGDSALRAIYLDLQAKLAKSVIPGRPLSALSPAVSKALAAACAWVVLGVFVFLSARANPAHTQFGVATALGMIVFAVPFVVLGAILPTFKASWINYIAYPIGHVTVVVVILLSWQKWSRSRNG